MTGTEDYDFEPSAAELEAVDEASWREHEDDTRLSEDPASDHVVTVIVQFVGGAADTHTAKEIVRQHYSRRSTGATGCGAGGLRPGGYFVATRRRARRHGSGDARLGRISTFALRSARRCLPSSPCGRPL
jgi:hypothetical protein